MREEKQNYTKDNAIRASPERTGKTEYTRYRFSGKELLRYTVTGIGKGGVIVWLTYHSLSAAPLAVIVAAAYLIMTNRRLCAERQKRLSYHFRDYGAGIAVLLRRTGRYKNVNTLIICLKHRQTADIIGKEGVVMPQATRKPGGTIS